MVTDKQIEAALRAWNYQPEILSMRGAMKAALEAAEQAAWLPIEDAPKRGRILLWNGFRSVVGEYEPKEPNTDEGWYGEDGHYIPTPTYFQYLLTPPKE